MQLCSQPSFRIPSDRADREKPERANDQDNGPKKKIKYISDYLVKAALTISELCCHWQLDLIMYVNCLYKIQEKLTIIVKTFWQDRQLHNPKDKYYIQPKY